MISWFKRKEKAWLDAAVRAVDKPATALFIEEAMPADHCFPATAMHFGGNPYFEEGDRWPTVGGSRRPYDFVCQVNLRECPESPQVPFDLFAVYLCWALVEAGDVDRACLVRTYREASPAKAVTIPRPSPIDQGDYQVRPCSVRTGRLMTYPWSIEECPSAVPAASAFRSPADAYHASLKRLGFWKHREQSRVGGFPAWVHDNTLVHGDMVFLAQIDYEPEANNCIQDAAPIFMAVSAGEPIRIETDAFQSH